MTAIVFNRNQWGRGGDAGGGGGATFPSNTWTALVGDSLTDDGVGVGPFYWQNGLSGGLLKLALNAGLSGTKVGYWTTAIDNAWNATYPGMSGLAAQLGVSKLGVIVLRICTNDADGNSINGTIQGQIDTVLSKALGYADQVWIMALPPIGGTEAAYNANVPAYNAYFQGKVAADPSHLKYLDDTQALYSGANANNALMDTKGTHPLAAGTRLMGVDGAALFSSLLSGAGFASPLITDSAHVYPTFPQWMANPVNAGTSGVASGGLSGTVATGLTISGGGAFAGTCSVVAADGGDPVTVPWQRVSITSTTAGSYVSISAAGSGRSITTSDPSRLEQVVQVRLSGLDLDKWTRLRTWFQGSDLYRLAPDLALRLGGGGTQTHTLVLRQAKARPTAAAPASSSLYLYLEAGVTASGLTGSFDFRCLTVEG